MYNDYGNTHEARPSALHTYRAALENAGPRLKEYILRKAENDFEISPPEFFALVKIAYPDDTP